MLGQRVRWQPIASRDIPRLKDHPEVKDRLWAELGGSLPHDCRFAVYGHPALVHPGSGIVFAIGHGRFYCLRVPQELLSEALAKGAKTNYPNLTWTDTQRDIGPDWILGTWLPEEFRWCQAAYERFGA
jgi:hypothetical protein